jgi:hypothetical protein
MQLILLISWWWTRNVSETCRELTGNKVMWRDICWLFLDKLHRKVRLDGTQGWIWVLYNILLSAEYPACINWRRYWEVNRIRGWCVIREGFREWVFVRCVSDVSGARVKWSDVTESEIRAEWHVRSCSRCYTWPLTLIFELKYVGLNWHSTHPVSDLQVLRCWNFGLLELS